MLILCALLVMMMLPDKRDRSYSDRSYSREEDLNKGIRYFSIGLHIVGFVSIFAAFFVTLIPFQKARGKVCDTLVYLNNPSAGP